MSLEQNPFFQDYDAPFGVPPLDQIKPEHFMPAFEKGLGDHKAEVDVIATDSEAPTFANTIEAMERAGSSLDRVANVFFNLTSSNTDDEIQKIQAEITPIFTNHYTDISLNDDLFDRIKSVYEQRDTLGLRPDQARLLDEYYKNYERAGANLGYGPKTKLKALAEKLSNLSVQFGQNVLKDTNNFELVITDKAELAGLPESVISMAAQTAKELGHAGAHVFTISRSSVTPFLQFAESRDLREKIYKAYVACGNNGDDFDNNRIVEEISTLRAESAKILGYKTHADYILADRMAGTPKAVNDLLNDLWEPTKRKALKEAKDLQDSIAKEGSNFTLAPWDWWYHTEKVRKERFNLDAEKIKPYFELGNVRDGAFYAAEKLYGITFKRRTDIPVHHPDVETYEVSDADGSHIGIFMVDYFMRPSKRGGAWMSSFRDQSSLDGEVRPIIINTCNFPKGADGEPSLMGFDEVRTLFHEFGHALHGLLTQCTYPSQSGTSVKRDFVELPSQIMEHWAQEPEVLKVYAKHYQTGEVIPDAYIAKIKEVDTFNQGFATMEYLAASVLDMDWCSLEDGQEVESDSFQQASMEKLGLIPEIAPRYASTHFQHIFSGGYSAGYYSYIWAEVLDEDGYDTFREKGIFDPERAKSFRENILEKGGSADPMDLYRAFRGQEPTVDALLKGRGLTD